MFTMVFGVADEPGEQVKSAVRIKNQSSSHVAFKFQTTAPKSCYMRPPGGILAPGESIIATVFKFVEQPEKNEKQPDKRCKVKFKIMSLNTGIILQVQLKNFLRSLSLSQLQKHFIPVVSCAHKLRAYDSICTLLKILLQIAFRYLKVRSTMRGQQFLHIQVVLLVSCYVQLRDLRLISRTRSTQ